MSDIHARYLKNPYCITLDSNAPNWDDLAHLTYHQYSPDKSVSNSDD